MGKYFDALFARILFLPVLLGVRNQKIMLFSYSHSYLETETRSNFSLLCDIYFKICLNLQ